VGWRPASARRISWPAFFGADRFAARVLFAAALTFFCLFRLRALRLRRGRLLRALHLLLLGLLRSRGVLAGALACLVGFLPRAARGFRGALEFLLGLFELRSRLTRLGLQRLDALLGLDER
jgi:hypothetical protein